MSAVPARAATSGVDAPTVSTILSGVRKFVPELQRRAADIERERRVPIDIIETLAGIGLFRMLQPRRFGGLEMGFHEIVQINMELGRGCGSTAWCATIATIHNWVVALFPEQTQQEVWQKPGALVAGAYVPNGQCESVPGGYRITGKWSFASNCDNSDWGVICTLLPPASEGAPPIQAWCLVPKADFRIEDTWFSVGMAGTGSKTIRIDTPTFIPSHRVLPVSVINSGDAPGAQVNSNPLYRLTFTGAAPFTLSSVPLGIATGALEHFVDIASNRIAAQPGGPPRPMAELPQVQLAVADASCAIDGAASLLLRDTSNMQKILDSGALPTIEDRILHRRNQSYAVNQSARAATSLFEAMGASGGDLSSPIQRAWRDSSIAARHISFVWATTGAMYGQLRLGQAPRGTF